jgi:addiction module HigA family antidote
MTMDIRFARPVHPGEMLREEFMIPLGLTAGKVARDIGVPRTRIERLVRQETALTVDTALRLARYFRMSDGYWVNMQGLYDINMLHNDAAYQARVNEIVPLVGGDLEDAA